MNTGKNFLHYLAQAIDQCRADHCAASVEAAASQPKRLGQGRTLLRWLMPNGGTLLLVALLILTQNVWARRTVAPTTASVTTIPYQGRLADINGDPVTGQVNMEFRLYDVPTGGTPLWEEYWTGGNSVSVSDGLFSVMLGSVNPTLADVVQGHDELYLGITVGTDSEMEPRVQLGSVPFSIWSMTVADDSITADKIAADAVGSEEIAADAVGSEEIAPGSVTQTQAPTLVSSVVSGTKILHGSVSVPVNESGNRGFVSIPISAAGFSELPDCFCTMDGINGYMYNCHVEYISTTSFGIWVRRIDGASWDSITVHWMAVGE